MKNKYRNNFVAPWRLCPSGRGCSWCAEDRQHATRKREATAEYIEDEAREEISDRINDRGNLYILKVC